MEITERVIEKLEELLEIELGENEYDMSLPEAGFDSLAFIQMVTFIEDEFEIEIPDEKLIISEMDTVRKILKLIIENIEV